MLVSTWIYLFALITDRLLGSEAEIQLKARGDLGLIRPSMWIRLMLAQEPRYDRSF